MSSPAQIPNEDTGGGSKTNPIFLGVLNVIWFLTVGWFLWDEL